MQGVLRVCPQSVHDSDDAFVERFEEQGRREDGSLAGCYADARALLGVYGADGCVVSSDEPLREVSQVWETSFRLSSEAFFRQLAVLTTTWEHLEEALGRYEDRYSNDTSDRAKATVQVLTKAVEGHYRSLMNLQVFQFWHRELFTRASEACEGLFESYIEGCTWWVAGAAFLDTTAVTRELNRVATRYAAFLTKTEGHGVRGTKGSVAVTLEQADAILSSRRVYARPPRRLVYLFGVCCGVILTCVVLLVFLLFFAWDVEGYDPDKHLYSVVPYFRGYFIVYVAFWLWSAVVARLESRGVNYPFIFNLTGRTISALHIAQYTAFLTAVSLSCFVLYLADVKTGMHLVPFFRSNPGLYIAIQSVLPILLLLSPFNVMEHQTRSWLCRILFGITLTPFIPCTFEGCFITDYLTSMAIPLTDISFSLCAVFTGGVLHNPVQSCSVEDSIWLPSVCAIVPAVWGALQCFRKSVMVPMCLTTRSHACGLGTTGVTGFWKVDGVGNVFKVSLNQFDMGTEVCDLVEKDGRFEGVLNGIDKPGGKGLTSPRIIVLTLRSPSEIEISCTIQSEEYHVTRIATRYHPSTARRPHVLQLINMVKYLCSTLPVVVGFFEADWGNHHSLGWSPGRIIYIICLFLTTVYLYTWDTLMDWGLWKRATFPPRGLVPCLGPYVWRNTSLDFRSKWWFLAALLFNLLGRLAWTFTIVAKPSLLGVETSLGNKEVLRFLLSLVEIVRRSAWGLIRISHQHEVDIGGWSGAEIEARSVPPMIPTVPWGCPDELSVLRSLVLAGSRVNGGDEESCIPREMRCPLSASFSSVAAPAEHI